MLLYVSTCLILLYGEIIYADQGYTGSLEATPFAAREEGSGKGKAHSTNKAFFCRTRQQLVYQHWTSPLNELTHDKQNLFQTSAKTAPLC